MTVSLSCFVIVFIRGIITVFNTCRNVRKHVNHGAIMNEAKWLADRDTEGEIPFLFESERSSFPSSSNQSNRNIPTTLQTKLLELTAVE